MKAASTPDQAEAAKMDEAFLTELTGNTHYIVLFQPVYRVATSRNISGYHVTAAGWLTDLADIKPAQ
jgi:hypothetical protein